MAKVNQLCARFHEVTNGSVCLPWNDTGFLRRAQGAQPEPEWTSKGSKLL